MASLTEIAEHFLAPMQDLLGEPKRHSPDSFYEVVNEVLEPFTVYQLKCAANDFKRSWQPGYWPTPAKMVAACERFPREESPKGDRPNYRKFEVSRDKADKRRFPDEQVFPVLSGTMGLQAANEGWARALYEHVSEHGTLPMPDEAAAMSRTARKNSDLALAVLRGEFVDPETGECKPLGGPVDLIKNFTRALQEKEAHYAAMIHQNQPSEAA